MRKPVFVIAIFVLLVLSFVDASAIGKVSYSLDVCDTAMTNRLFNVDVLINTSSKSVSSSVINITYDTDIVKLKGVKSVAGEVQYTDNNGLTKTVYADVGGVKSNSDTKLISLTFKSLREGTFDMYIDCTESVYSDYSYAVVCAQYGCTVTISGNSITAKRHKKSSDTLPVIKGKGSSVKGEYPDNNVSYINAQGDHVNLLPYVLGGAVAGVVILVFFVGISLGKIFSVKKQKAENPTDKS